MLWCNFFLGSNAFFLCFKLWFSIVHNHTATQRKTKSKPLMSWTTVFRQILQLNIEPVSSLVYLFVTFSMLPKWKDILYISLFRVSHYDCGRKTWNISIMYIKRRSCLVFNLLFHNAISTLITRLVLKVKDTSVSKISILRHFNKVAIYLNRISLRSYLCLEYHKEWAGKTLKWEKHTSVS